MPHKNMFTALLLKALEVKTWSNVMHTMLRARKRTLSKWTKIDVGIGKIPRISKAVDALSLNKQKATPDSVFVVYDDRFDSGQG